MKRTPQKQKKKNDDKNRFRFQSFNERVAEITIGVARRFDEIQELDEDADTFFHQGLEKWRELNCTAHFTDACRDLPRTRSLPQVIHHQADIVAVLKKHLTVSNSLALPPLLDLVLQLARDLHSGFYVYFEDFFNVFVTLLYTNNPDCIEQVYTTLAYLVKFLWHCLLKHINTVFKYYRVLLSDTQKPYITAFAAESFAYLVRKLRKPAKFIAHVAASLEDDEHCQGVGLLLFESVKGVRMQFHSSTETLLSTCLPHLGHPSCPNGNEDMVLDVLLRCMQEMAEYTRQEYCAFIWPLLLSYVERTLQEYVKATELPPDGDSSTAPVLWTHMERILRLVQKWITWRWGTRMDNATDVYKSVENILKLAAPASESHAVCGVVIDLVHYVRPFQPTEAKPIVDKVLSASSCRQALEFAHHLAALGAKGLEVLSDLPGIVEGYAADEQNHVDLLIFLSSMSQSFQDSCSSAEDQLVLDLSAMPHTARMLASNCQLPEDGLDDTSLDVRSQRTWSTANALRICRCVPTGMDIASNLSLWLSLLCRHLGKLTCATENLSQNEAAVGNLNSTSFAIRGLCGVLISLQGADIFLREFSLPWVLELLRMLPSDIHVLKTALSVLDAITDAQSADSAESGGVQVLDAEGLAQVFAVLQVNLSHPLQPVRLATLQVLARFQQPTIPSMDEEGGSVPCPVIQFCLEAQEVQPSLQEFREKLRLLDQLKYIASRQDAYPEMYKEVALRYLIGSLYVNFQPLWTPVSELITSYTTNANRKMFWKVYSEHLTVCTSRCRELADAESVSSRAASEGSEAAALAQSLPAVFSHTAGRASISGEDSRVDHLNFRMQLWRTMALFPSSSEASTRFVVPIFLSYVREEYSCLDDAVLKHQDLRHPDQRNNNNDNSNMSSQPAQPADLMDVDGEDESAGQDACEEQQTKSSQEGAKKNRRMLFKTLSTMLSLFSKFIDPRSAHKAADMKQLMLQLLCHRDEDIQSLALQYLMAYKPDFLLPYRENLFNLLKETGFRDCLTHFSIDEESGVVKSNHRAELIPYLIRILYGCMLRGTGASTTGKQGIRLRHGVVLRFLAGCPSEEVKVFIDLVSAPFQSLIQGDVATSAPLPALDISHVVPLRTQQGFLTMVGQVFSHLRNVIPAFLSSVLRVILCITSWVGKLLKMCRAQAKSKVPAEELLDIRIVSLLRTLRQLALARLTEMFDLFPQWDFEVHMKNILEVAVWPQLGALPTECLQHPTPLMKLLLGWSQRRRFLGYFSAPTPDGMHSSILHYVFACLQSAAVRPPVVQAIMQMVENLLNNGDEQKDADSLEPSAKRRKVSTSAQSTTNLHTNVSHERGNVAASADGLAVAQCPGTTGENLLLPHLHMILEHLGSLVINGSSSAGKHSSAAKKPNQGGKVPLQYLATLSRMSEFVESPSLSEKLIKAFLPLASKSLIYGDALSNVLLTISHLMQRVPDVEQFILPLSRLLATVKVRSARQHLCSSLKVIAASCQQFQKVADIVQDLNSWDPKRLEEPDFERRLDAFTLSAEFLASSSEPRLVLALVYSSLYTIHQVDDIALRDCACHLLHKLIQRLAVVLEGADEDVWNKQVLNSVLLPALQQGVRSKSETVRHEFVALLSEAVRSLSGVCPRLANLQPLHTEDLETDFFENIRHIQMHRRTNAFRFLATQLEEGHVPATTTASFVLPLANSYLDTPGSDHNLVTQVVAVLAALAKQSPWPRYKSLLQRFLRLLVRGSDQQKVYIRVVVSILESFHFDVKSVDPALFAETNPMVPLPAGKSHAKDSVSQETEKKPAIEKADDSESQQKKDSEGEAAPAIDKDDDVNEANNDAEIEAEVAQDVARSSNEDMEDEAVLLQRKNTLARRIFTSLRCDIIPELDTVLSRKVADGAGGNHRLSSHENDNADLIVSMPVALAVVKLFQKLPEEIMHAHLPGLLLKVCNVLRSRSKDVRDTAKQSLVKISCSLGPRYLSWVLKELRAALSRGYQLHILGHALHFVLDAMVETITAGEVDDSVVSAMQVVSEDLFGEVAAEREVGKIADKVPEARSSRSRLIVQLLAQVVSGDEVHSILNPMREVLKTTQSLKVVHCVEECLRHISLGLLANTAMQAQSLLVMVHGACKDNNSGLGMVSGKNMNSTFMPAVTEEKRPTRPALYSEQLLPKAPVRGAKAPGMSKVTNMHIMIEFSLQLLLSCFKRSSINTTDKEILRMLDPLCGLLSSFLGTQHVKLLSISLRCLVHLLPLPLPAMQRLVGGIVKHLFKVLKEYSVAGAALGNNHEMIVAATKAMTTIVRSFKKHKITDHQLELLMTYVEEDIHDFSRKGTAFPLLKAILSRKFQAPIIHDVMMKVLELLVMADVDTVQLNCRQAMMQYLLDYALGKKVQKHVNFLVKHLEFRVESGRESVLEMLNLIFTKFPAAAITDNAGLFFVTIAPRVINDESVLCRKLASLAIKSLLEKVEEKERNSLFSIVLLWLDDKTLPIQRLGYQITGVFVGMEGASFERRLAQFLPLLLKALISQGGGDDDDDDTDAEGTASDHVIFTALTCLTKIIAKSQLLSSEKHRDSMNSIWSAVEGLLLHPHDWVRLYCCRLFGFLFAHWPVDKLLASAQAPASAGRKRKHAGVETVYLRSDAAMTISLLARRFLSQLSVDNVNEELSLQIIKNLVYVAKVLCLQDAKTTPANGAVDSTGAAEENVEDASGDEEENDDDDDTEAAEDPKKPVDLSWLIKKMVRISKYEAGHNQRQSSKRTCVLRWLAALTQIMHQHSGQHSGLEVHLATMLAPVLSLMHDKTKLAGADLYTLAETVLQEMRTKAGHEVFTAASMQAERGIREKRDKRRQQRLLQNVANPELAAQRKIKLNSAKKEAKKRKQKEERKTAKTLQRRKRYNKR